MVLRIKVLTNLSFEKLRSLEADDTGAVRISLKHLNVNGNRFLYSKQLLKASGIEAMFGFEMEQ